MIRTRGSNIICIFSFFRKWRETPGRWGSLPDRFLNLPDSLHHFPLPPPPFFFSLLTHLLARSPPPPPSNAPPCSLAISLLYLSSLPSLPPPAPVFEPGLVSADSGVCHWADGLISDWGKALRRAEKGPRGLDRGLLPGSAVCTKSGSDVMSLSAPNI